MRWPAAARPSCPAAIDRHHPVHGRGGPNQEFALALALEIDGLPAVSALAADTDGTDGGAGAATDPAARIIDETTLTRARARGSRSGPHLADNDSTGFFETLATSSRPGPTFTNVNDLRVILVDGLRLKGAGLRLMSW